MANLHELVTAAESNPDDWDTRLQLAQAYKELGMADEALNALRGNPLAPMTMGQSRLVKELRLELDPEGKTSMSQPVHPVSGKVMERAPIGGSEEEWQPQHAAVIVDSSPISPVLADESHHGDRSIVLAGEVDPNTI